MPTTEELFAAGAAHYREGRWQQAQQILQQVIQAAPGHAPALHLLSVIALQTGQPLATVDYLQRA
jgi:hypothetical protein